MAWHRLVFVCNMTYLPSHLIGGCVCFLFACICWFHGRSTGRCLLESYIQNLVISHCPTSYRLLTYGEFGCARFNQLITQSTLSIINIFSCYCYKLKYLTAIRILILLISCTVYVHENKTLSQF